MGRPIASVVVPAHDEEALIGRCLRSLLETARPGELEVIVACNACTDRTAAIAGAINGVRVLDIEEASKHAAMDAADGVSSTFPRVYLDADIRVTTEAIRSLVSILEDPDVEAAAPRLTFDVEGRSWAVRQYFGVFERLPAFGPGYVGSGLFALSEAGRARFGAWPRGLPDDLFAARLIPQQARVTSEGVFVIPAPGSLRSQLRRSVRVQGLKRALERDQRYDLEPSTAASTSRFLLSEARHPRQWSGVALVASLSTLSRVRARLAYRGGRDAGWMRDVSTRGGTPVMSAADSKDPGEQRTASVEVVVVTYNSERDIGGFLDALQVAIAEESAVTPGSSDVNVTVVDNVSRDRTLEFARAHPLRPVILETGANVGYAAAINVAMEGMPDEGLVVVANPDIRVQSGFLGPLLAAAREPDVGVIATRLVDATGTPLPSQRRAPAVRHALAEALLGGHRAARLGLGELVTGISNYEQARDLDWAAGALLAVTPAARRCVGTWDGSYFLYSEETDYLLRVRDAGLRVRYEPGAVAFHRGGASHTDPELWRILACNRVRLFRRRHGRAHTAAFWCAAVLNELLRAPRSVTHRLALAELIRQRRALLCG